MNFEEAVRRCREGVATEEEREFVKAQLSAAKKLMGLNFEDAMRHYKEGVATAEEVEYIKKQLELAETEQKAAQLDDIQADVKADEAQPAAMEQPAEAQPAAAAQQPAAEPVQPVFEAQKVEYVETDSVYDKAPAAPIKPAEAGEVKKAKKSFRMRYVILPLTIILVAVLLVGAVLGGVFGYASVTANRNAKFDRDGAVAEAKEYIAEAIATGKLVIPNDVEVVATDFWVEDVDRDFVYNPHNIGRSYYAYNIELKAQKPVGAGYGARILEIELDVSVNTATGSVMIVKRSVDYD